LQLGHDETGVAVALIGQLRNVVGNSIDLGPALLKDQTPEDLMVHPTDPSPNEIAHRIAAEAIEQFLRRQGFIA